LWGGVSNKKTIYDPCPEGWRVPRRGHAPYDIADLEKNMFFIISGTNNVESLLLGCYPITDGIGMSGEIERWNVSPFIWTATPAHINLEYLENYNTKEVLMADLISAHYVCYPQCLRYWALNVRCIRYYKEEQ
jgi:hypothetical protein